MPLVSNDQHGAVYEFGFEAADAPTITGFVARNARLNYAPESMAQATDGEGHVDSVTVSKANKRMVSAEFSGYITDAWDPDALPNTFSFDGRFYIITGISEPREKGGYVEVSISANSWAGVTS